jgi:hypothetical protein
VADWQTISALATAAGTLVLAWATFSAVRSSNRSARIAEEALLTGMRPLLVQSLASDPTQKVFWSDRHAARLEGGRAVVDVVDDVVYLAIGLHNVGSGIALLHGWQVATEPRSASDPHAEVADFRRLTIDLFVAPGAPGYWEGALRDLADPERSALIKVIGAGDPFTIDLLYGDQYGGQRTVSRFTLLHGGAGAWLSQATRHWNMDRPDPR